MPKNKRNKRRDARGTAPAEDASIPAEPGLDSALYGRTTGESGEENLSDEEVARDKERAAADRLDVSREQAVKVLKEIGSDFVKLRKSDGRSGAWAGLEEKLMLNAHIFISAGLMSPKDLIGMATEIEGFRKSEGGTQMSPGDLLAEWLTGDEKTDAKKKTVKSPKAKAA